MNARCLCAFASSLALSPSLIAPWKFFADSAYSPASYCCSASLKGAGPLLSETKIGPDRMARLRWREFQARIDGERLLEFVTTLLLAVGRAMDEGEVLVCGRELLVAQAL